MDDPAGQALEAIVSHRPYQPLKERTGRDFAGMDAALVKIGFGARYGLIRGLDAGLFRLNGTIEEFDSYDSM